MNYLFVYMSLIEKRKNNPVSNDLYSELHHIIPKCQGGDDSRKNLVRLTAKEHYIAHHLLYKHYKTPALAHAWFSMLRCDPNQKRSFTAKQHEMAKIAHADSLKRTMLGKNNPFYGKQHSIETRKRLSTSMSQWYVNNEISKEKKDNWIEKVARKPASEKQKAAASTVFKNKIILKNIETGERVRIDKSQKHLYNESIWKNPSAISQRRDTCTYCGVTSTAGNIKRWHDENCKKKSHNNSTNKETYYED